MFGEFSTWMSSPMLQGLQLFSQLHNEYYASVEHPYIGMFSYGMF